MAVRRNTSRRKAAPAEKNVEEARVLWGRTWLDEAAALICFSVALFLLLSFCSHLSMQSGLPDDLSHGNIMGPVGHLAATMLVGFMGWCFLVPIFCLIWFSVFLWRYDSENDRTGMGLSWYSPLGFTGVLIFSSAIASIFWGQTGGGSVGSFIAVPLVRLLNTWGAALAAAAALLLSLTLTTRLSAVDIGKNLLVALAWIMLAFFQIPAALFRLLAAAARWCFAHTIGLLAERFPARSAEKPLPRPRRRKNAFPAPAQDEEPQDQEAESSAAPAEEEAQDESGEDAMQAIEEYRQVLVSRHTPQVAGAEKRSGKGKKAGKASVEEREEGPDGFSAYKNPSISLLTPGEITPGGEDDNELLEKSRMIESKLRDFGVLGRVTEVHPGPVITLFEFEPAPGVKVGRVAALADDLSMSLRASSIRIIAPIPKRGTVGIEIPNRHRDIVRLRDVLESEAFAGSDSVLSVCVGKDTYGEPVVCDIASMPHLLMAGATGTGKSVCINAFLLSLLYRASPAELGLIMIDPKILELSVYEGIPHLRVPVVVNPRQAKAVLHWAVDEMHRRYRLIQKFGVRNIDGYNRIVSGEQSPEKPGQGRLDDNVVMLSEEEVLEDGIVEKPEIESSEPLVAEKLQPLPKILIVIDEVADLMLSVGRDIEELITRLAQKARAAGIHLIIATQRPSVDVVTGLIKANFPARLSFRVSSRIDSRTILDSMGAEKLLGRGDMLFMQPGGEALRRVHGAFVSDNEVKRVVNAVKQQCSPQYDQRIMQICEKALEEEENSQQEGGTSGIDDGEYDPVYDKAVELVVEKGQASTSMIQRVFRIGYNRAARIIEVMEKEGVVGPMDGAKPREVLVARQSADE